MTDNEKKLRRALELVIDLYEDAFNKRGDYCDDFCPVRDHDGNCPAHYLEEDWDGEDEYDVHWERDYKRCMDLRVKYFVEKANE